MSEVDTEAAKMRFRQSVYEKQRAILWEKPCPFCPIIGGDAPANVVERGDRHLAFVPMGPHVPGHVLFVPLAHLPDATVAPELAAVVFAEACRYVRELGVPANVLTSIGTTATQSVPHLHVHVIPRGPDDGLSPRWPWIAHQPQAHAAIRQASAEHHKRDVPEPETPEPQHETSEESA